MKKLDENLEPGTQEWMDNELAFAVKFLNEKYKRIATQSGSSISDPYWQDKLDKSVDEAYADILARANKANVGKGDSNLTRRAIDSSSFAKYPAGVDASSKTEGKSAQVSQAGKLLQTMFHILAAMVFCFVFLVDDPWVVAVVILCAAGVFNLGELFSPKS